MTQLAIPLNGNQVRKRAFPEIIKKYWMAYVLILPAIVLRMTYTVLPLIQTIWMSFTSKAMTNPGKFIGLNNFIFLFKDELFLNSIGWTFFYAFAATVAETALGLAIAVLLNQKLRLQGIAIFIVMLPWVIAPMLAGTIWKLMFYESGGIFNQILVTIGIVKISWLTDKNWARFAVIIVSIWKNVAWVSLIFLAGLRSISKEILEAAEVDGAGAWKRFWLVSFPLLSSTTLLVLLLRGMGEVQTFEQIYGLTLGGPGTATRTIAMYAYERFFTEFAYGYGSAINVILLILTVSVGYYYARRLFNIEK
jgi:multiple sugar transport system permease protein